MKIMQAALALLATTAITNAADAAEIVRTYTFTSVYSDDPGNRPFPVPYTNVVQTFTLTFDPYSSDRPVITNYSSNLPGTFFSPTPDVEAHLKNGSGLIQLYGGDDSGSRYGLGFNIDADGNPSAAEYGAYYNIDATDGYFAITTKATLGSPSNVSTDGVSPVPEPASWAMMLAGFGVMGASLRYRRRASAIGIA
jgi:hypothetical protein